ncbi:hypothetical protein Vadar_030288 [Vaccinium darrowii]|uniref:Uncharacterized protein n=1 Tax=Vaccinium darrowii TaxID=229202 RepID=A0ACB7XDN8_9ERIC|nr:hypothetical protein Vadar_030288 [Vaccinium darrowii]
MADLLVEGSQSQPVDLSKHPSGIVPTLQNIVSTVNLDCKLELKAIALQARNAEYNPKYEPELNCSSFSKRCPSVLYRLVERHERECSLEGMISIGTGFKGFISPLS